MAPKTKPKAASKPALPPPGPSAHAPLPLAWDGDRLLVTDPDAVAKIARKRLSPSTAKSMHGCGARYAGEKLMRGQEDPFAPAPQGTSVHSVLELLYSMPMPQRTREALIAHAKAVLAESAVPNAGKGWPGIDLGRHDEWLANITTNAMRIFEIEDPTTIQVRALEMKLDTVELEGVPFTGFVDRIDITGDTHTFGSGIVDYKSGKQPNTWAIKQSDGHGDQLRLYTAALNELDGVKPLWARLFYTATGKSRDVPIGPRLVAKTVAGFVESWDIHNRYVNDSAFGTESSALCGWCPLVNSCPVAARDDKVARIDGLPTAVMLGIPTFRPLADLVTVDADLDPGDPDYMPSEPPDWLPTDPGYPDPDALSSQTEPPAHESDEPADPDGDPDLDSGRPRLADAELIAVAALAAAAVGVDDGTAPTHVSISTAAPTTKAQAAPMNGEAAMSEKRKLYEDKPWEETANNDLNPASYAAVAAVDLTEKAKEALLDAGLPLTRPSLAALAGTYFFVVGRVQESFTGQTSLQHGMNSRLRYLLTRHLRTNPAPLGGTAEEWQIWIASAIKRIQSIASVALDLWDGGFPGEEVYAPLVGLQLPTKQLKAV